MTSRKKNAEIDRVLKHLVKEKSEFDALWSKTLELQDEHQRAKHEDILKRDLKKLQRYRDQIRAWLADPTIKERDEELSKYRRQIEEEMERFRAFERESKDARSLSFAFADVVPPALPTEENASNALPAAAAPVEEEEVLPLLEEWMDARNKLLQELIHEHSKALRGDTKARGKIPTIVKELETVGYVFTEHWELP